MIWLAVALIVAVVLLGASLLAWMGGWVLLCRRLNRELRT